MVISKLKKLPSRLSYVVQIQQYIWTNNHTKNGDQCYRQSMFLSIKISWNPITFILFDTKCQHEINHSVHKNPYVARLFNHFHERRSHAFALFSVQPKMCTTRLRNRIYQNHREIKFLEHMTHQNFECFCVFRNILYTNHRLIQDIQNHEGDRRFEQFYKPRHHAEWQIFAKPKCPRDFAHCFYHIWT